MVQDKTVGVEALRRSWSLRREWSRAFTILLVVLLVASLATFAGVREVVAQFSGPARQLDEESTIVLSLQASLAAHEATAHLILAGVPVDRHAFLREQAAISVAFDKAQRAFPAASDDAFVSQAERSWQAALTKVGLWGDRLAGSQGPRPQVLQVQLASDSDHARGVLADLQTPSLVAMRRGLAKAADLAWLLMVGLAGLFGLAVAITVYFRRRMAKDLVRPVADLHRGVVKLQSGDYGHRIDVARRDELGEVAEALNGMAGALHESHLALTLQATHDSLTGLANRAALTERLTASFGARADRRSRKESLLFIDVDDFKYVNDSLGHEGGDALLMQLADRLSECVRAHDLVARLGGDEFALVVVEDPGATVAVEVAQRVLAALQAPFVIGGHRLAVSVSIGVAQPRPDTGDPAELLRRADFAMYMAKGAGKGRFQLFDGRVHDQMVGRSTLKADLAVAVSSGQLRLEYQPIVDLGTGEIVGVEALVRWLHPTLGCLAPAEFIPLAEETGDIDAIGYWVLDTATREVAGWRQAMDHCVNLWLAVNLSACQLTNPNSLAPIQRILIDPAAQARNLVLEVTETALADAVDGGIASLGALKSLGVRIAIDDFGTGFSSLSTLASLPVDILKIDRSFVSGQASALPSMPMLEGILGLAKNLSLAVIAEGIEEPEQLDLLRTLGCPMGQGYHLARPTPADQLEALLVSGGRLPVPVP
jgi:diguanylate cyclase (GGDEF)-like protein